MKPHIRRVWNGVEQQWGWAVTRGWVAHWGKTLREAWRIYAEYN